MSGADGAGAGDRTKRREVVGEITPFDPTASIEAAVAGLDAIGTAYALIGGLALEAWGIPRATKDVDIAVPLGAAEPVAVLVAGTGGERHRLRIGGVAGATMRGTSASTSSIAACTSPRSTAMRSTKRARPAA